MLFTPPTSNGARPCAFEPQTVSIKRVTAIMPADLLKELEGELRRCGVPGVTARGAGTRAGIVAVESIDRLVSLEHGTDLTSDSLNWKVLAWSLSTWAPI